MKLYFSENIIDESLLGNYLKKICKYKIIISEEGIFKITDKIYKEYCEDKSIHEITINNLKLFLDKSELEYKEVYAIPLNHLLFEYEEVIYKKDIKSSTSLIIKKTKNYKDYYFDVNINNINYKLEVEEYIKLLNLK